MGFFKKAAPNDALINEFWKWFIGYESTLIDVVKGMNAKTPDDKKAYDAVIAISEWMDRICFDTKKLVDFKFGGDASARLELVFFPEDKYILSNVKRIAELMPAVFKERWDIIILTDFPDYVEADRILTGK
jgi:hypothetical protein